MDSCESDIILQDRTQCVKDNILHNLKFTFFLSKTYHTYLVIDVVYGLKTHVVCLAIKDRNGKNIEQTSDLHGIAVFSNIVIFAQKLVQQGLLVLKT